MLRKREGRRMDERKTCEKGILTLSFVSAMGLSGAKATFELLTPRTKHRGIICTISAIAPAAVAASAQLVFVDVFRLRCCTQSLSGLVTMLLAFCSYYFGRRLISGRFCKSKEDKLIDAIIRIKLEVKIDSSGEVTTTVSVKSPEPKDGEASDSPQDDGRTVVEHKDGNTYYRIENLNIYLNADSVHQLNVNPEKVINAIKDELKAGTR